MEKIYIAVPHQSPASRWFLTPETQPDKEAGDCYILGDHDLREIICIENGKDLLTMLEYRGHQWSRVLAILEAVSPEILQDYFIYTLDSGNYLRRKDEGLTEAQTIRKDFTCPHEDEASCTCMQECEDAIVYGYAAGEVTAESLAAFQKEYGKINIEG